MCLGVAKTQALRHPHAKRLRLQSISMVKASSHCMYVGGGDPVEGEGVLACESRVMICDAYAIHFIEPSEKRVL